MINRILITLISGICLVSLTAQSASIYQCTDETGHPVFTDGKTKTAYTGCKVVLKDESPEPSVASPMRAAYRPNTGNKGAITPADFPRVDKQTQLQRDDKRKQILISELEAEQKALTDAKAQQAIAEADSHEKNIQLLQKELSAMR